MKRPASTPRAGGKTIAPVTSKRVSKNVMLVWISCSHCNESYVNYDFFINYSCVPHLKTIILLNKFCGILVELEYSHPSMPSPPSDHFRTPLNKLEIRRKLSRIKFPMNDSQNNYSCGNL